jgi:hydrogenase nickel incorporation protein HypA/HybF
MHELPVTESILEIALRYAQEAKATRITKLHLVIGQLATLVDDSIQFYWNIIAKDTIAEDALLDFKRIPAEFLCLDCNERYVPGEEILACPKCQSLRIKIIAGEEFCLESIDVETAEDPAPPEINKNAN